MHKSPKVEKHHTALLLNCYIKLKQFDNLSYDDEFQQWKIKNKKELLNINASRDNFNQLVGIIKYGR